MRHCHVRLVPKADIRLFDYLVVACQRYGSSDDAAAGNGRRSANMVACLSMAIIQVPPGERPRGTDAGPHRGRILPHPEF